eukprot:Opistho-2@29845
MVKKGIEIFARIKPTKNAYNGFQIEEPSELSTDTQSTRIQFHVKREASEGIVNNKKETYKFKFNHIFKPDATQDQVFDVMAKKVILSVLQGYNGTIFAYGQTGSGKTFTITGGAERYADRGIIPRSLSFIFSEFAKRTNMVFTAHVSYMEIYNDNGYDLLDPNHEIKDIEDLPKVALMEDEGGNVTLKNLSTPQATSEEDALNLLFMGDTNRMIAETPMNLASSRSHCIFTVHIAAREAHSEVLRRSKLHLVDLAGSERIGKTNVEGKLLSEAKYINLSLHYLEQVIVALGEKADGKRSHIPYRNSMMTSVLRDSLGGNCMTTMIATLSVEQKNVDESISTSRFAQRVALIANDAQLNEELDPSLVIARLKREVQQLRDELALATGGDADRGPLTQDDIDQCRALVTRFVEDRDPEGVINLGDMRKIQECFRQLRTMIYDRPVGGSSDGAAAAPNALATIANPGPSTAAALEGPDSETKVRRLTDLLHQRDNEINILVEMLKKKKAQDGASASGPSSLSQLQRGTAAAQPSYAQYTQQPNIPAAAALSVDRQLAGPPGPSHAMPFVDRGKAFEIFKSKYPHNSAIHENKVALKAMYTEAKSLGERVNEARTKINHLKSTIERLRVDKAMQGLSSGDVPDRDEERMRSHIEDEKAAYKDNFERLRGLKTEIEHVQHILEKQRIKMEKDFERWFTDVNGYAPPPPAPVAVPPQRPPQDRTSQGRMDMSAPAPGPTPHAAWRTPPAGHPISGGASGGPPTGYATVQSGTTHPPASNYQVRQQTSQPGLHGGQGSTLAGQPRPPPAAGAPTLTGDSRTDADIIAFYRAKESMMKTKR